jgi:putative chitinase
MPNYTLKKLPASAAFQHFMSHLTKDQTIVDVRQRAYVMATVKHETADTWEPIYERGARTYFNKYEPGTHIGVRLGNVKPGDGYRYRGRGYVQITGRHNYARLSAVLNVDLVETPDLALDEGIAYMILSLGMSRGLFTGKALNHYIIPGEPPDYLNARRIINGLDRAAMIASYAQSFERLIAVPCIPSPIVS